MIGNERKLLAFIPVCCAQEKWDEESSRKHERLLLYGLKSFVMVPLESAMGVSTESVGRK